MVDDGSPEPAEVGPTPRPVKIVRLPAKTMALNPCVPFNVGVAHAVGDLIVLTNPEVIHRTAILPVMAERLRSLGPLGYVAAACRGRGWWYCHSKLMPADAKVGRAPSPPGAGLHFCAMLHRSLYEAIGGFTEAYRDGQGYDDNDLLWKLDAAGAKFEICDDLVCEHVQCPPSLWPVGGVARNRKLFNEAWPDHAHLVQTPV